MSAEIYSKNFNDMLRQLHQNIQKNRNLIEIRYRLKKRRNRKIIRLEQFFFKTSALLWGVHIPNSFGIRPAISEKNGFFR